VWWLAPMWMNGNFCHQKTVEKVTKLVMNDRRLSVCFTAESVIGISTGSVHSIFTENLLMKKMPAACTMGVANVIQHSEGKSSWRINKSTPPVKRESRNFIFISWFLTVDKTWFHSFDAKSKMKSMALKHVYSPPPRKFCTVVSAHEVMATVFWDAEGIVLTDYLEHGIIITGIYYADLIIEKFRWR